MTHVAYFDLDGTIIDSRDDLASAVNDTRRACGLAPLPRERIVACVGDGMLNLMRRAIPECADRLDDILPIQRENYRRHLLDATQLYPTVRETLETLTEHGWKLGVVTNKPGDFSRIILQGLHVAEFFSAIVGGGDTPTLKPDVAPLHAAALQLGEPLTPHQWIVGDHVTDMRLAAAAGLQACFCRFGFGELRDAHFTLAIDQMRDFATHVLTTP